MLRLILILLLLLISYPTIAQEEIEEPHGIDFDNLAVITPENIDQLVPVGVVYISNSPSFSPDGRFLVTGRDIWNLETGRLRRELEPECYAARFATNSLLVAPGGHGRFACVWRFSTGFIHTLLFTENPPLNIEHIVVSPDGRFIATGGGGYFEVDSRGFYDNIVRVWDSETGELMYDHYLGSVHDLQFSPDGSLLAASTPMVMKVWHTETGEEIFNVEGKPVYSSVFFQFNPDGSLLAGMHPSGQLAIWDTQTWTPTMFFDSSLELNPIAFSPNGERLLTRTGYDFRLWPLDGLGNQDTAQQPIIEEFTEHSECCIYPSRWAFNSELTLAAVLLDDADNLIERAYENEIYINAFSGHLVFWSTETGTIARILPVPAANSGSVHFSPNNRLVAISSFYGGPHSYIVLLGVPRSPDYIPTVIGEPRNRHPYGLPPTELECPESPSSRLNLGDWAYVPTAGEAGTNRNIRVRTSPGGEQVGSLEPGNVFAIVGGPVCGDDGLLWWAVQSTTDSTLVGWSVEGFAPDDYLMWPVPDPE
jgi:WD40 repeat protein